MELSSHTTGLFALLHPSPDMKSLDADNGPTPVRNSAWSKLLPVSFTGRLLWSIPFTIIAGFCLFGFVATFEPMPRVAQWSWRAICSCVGIGAVLEIGWLWLYPRRHR
jgi:hypothetical protein